VNAAEEENAWLALSHTGRTSHYFAWEKRRLAGRVIASVPLPTSMKTASPMAVAALRDALTAMDAATIDALYFASRTPPYAEKQSATTIGWAANLRTDIFTVDCTDSLRAGTNALKLAMDATKAASAKRVAVGAADNRLAQPRSSFERTFGDGAATLVVGVEKLRDNPYTGLAVGTGNLTSGVDPAVPPPVQFALAATRYAHITISPWRSSSASWLRSR
jgi:3-oxoacyl-[acyl-carrier-protein] synthase III